MNNSDQLKGIIKFHERYLGDKKTNSIVDRMANDICEKLDIPTDPTKRSDKDNWSLALALGMLGSFLHSIDEEYMKYIISYSEDNNGKELS